MDMAPDKPATQAYLEQGQAGNVQNDQSTSSSLYASSSSHHLCSKLPLRYHSVMLGLMAELGQLMPFYLSK